MRLQKLLQSLVSVLALSAVATAQNAAPVGSQAAAADALASWCRIVADRLVELGMGPAAANALASTTISVLEGAQLMCRVAKSREALDVAAGHLERMVGS